MDRVRCVIALAILTRSGMKHSLQYANHGATEEPDSATKTMSIYSHTGTFERRNIE